MKQLFLLALQPQLIYMYSLVAAMESSALFLPLKGIQVIELSAIKCVEYVMTC